MAKCIIHTVGHIHRGDINMKEQTYKGERHTQDLHKGHTERTLLLFLGTARLTPVFGPYTDILLFRVTLAIPSLATRRPLDRSGRRPGAPETARNSNPRLIIMHQPPGNVLVKIE